MFHLQTAKTLQKPVQFSFIAYGHNLKHLRVCLIILEGLSETPAQLESVFISINVSNCIPALFGH